MRPGLAFAALALLLMGGCKEEAEAPPPPFALTREAMGRYCGMNVAEHGGPKGQVILARYIEPIWFSTARDAIAFTMLPDEPKDIRAIYVSDMAKAPSWEKPGAENWIDAKGAYFVLDSRRNSAMGTREAVPFSSEGAAAAFAREHGGHVLRFGDLPRDYILDAAGADSAPPDAPPPGKVD
ncbi:nitrous oxide reductase accessory protein NosL [Enterovirga sp.]|uniref:nitrous oxide reductase accessory protein NosL n=1 Tax=Enterovirga sp. TaxID=2026350 RepID=UPI003FA56A24